MSLIEEDEVILAAMAVEPQVDWWDAFVKDNYSNEKCLQYFKCSRKTFTFLVKLLKPHIAPKIGALDSDSPLYLRKGVSVDKQVAVLLYKLTTCVDYVGISKKFKIHKTTIHKILYKSVIAINKYLLHSTISMPKPEEAEIICNDFEQAYKLPQIIGAMTLAHIPISSPINLNYKFLNSKLYPSFVLQTVIDSNFLFRDVSVRHAGATEPQLIIADSNIYKYSHKVMPPEKRNIGGIDISYKIIAPAPGPLYRWLLNSYDEETTKEETRFNNCLEEIRNYADSVISRLRSRFLILSHMMDLSYKVAPQVIAACCIIHNICERNGDTFLDEWLTESADRLKRYPQPDMQEGWEKAEKVVLDERDILKDYVNSLETDEIDATLN
ncbi:putative nuclease HARBI1 [Nasonia vitripennis]|uniref:DDE Tnp4 domain-containing protein n=1 Tax=Nasonia vitripennis TaxID=7425 RepID=A0A7M7H8V9_NASVI|nr:putative nuclease HARBI1 [Nasonia vitripennis]XP_008214278.1 putative nuclease HARBI1 [Nasonia vitripennis]XP_032454576.1 putative nuclease HARBI1 [Nasonia vitripennis]